MGRPETVFRRWSLVPGRSSLVVSESTDSGDTHTGNGIDRLASANGLRLSLGSLRAVRRPASPQLLRWHCFASNSFHFVIPNPACAAEEFAPCLQRHPPFASSSRFGTPSREQIPRLGRNDILKEYAHWKWRKMSQTLEPAKVICMLRPFSAKITRNQTCVTPLSVAWNGHCERSAGPPRGF
jgi:hypothetical protein